jgi:hypothetical protein
MAEGDGGVNEIDKYWYDKLLDLRNFVGNQDLNRDPYMLMVEVQEEVDNMMKKEKK